MRKFKKISYSIMALCILTRATSFVSSAADDKRTVDNGEGSVIGTYISNPELEAAVAEKQQLAENMYAAICSGNTMLASQYQSQMASFNEEKCDDNQLSAQSANVQSVSAPIPPPTDCRIGSMRQQPQEKNYYCGPAAAKSVLDILGAVKSQSFLAGSSYLQTEQYNGTPWYISNGNSNTQFPMFNTLNGLQSRVYYIPSPMGNAGSNPLTTTQCKSYVVSSISSGHGLTMNGTSKASSTDLSHLPNYPNQSISHWVACDGYINNGAQIRIVDPAKSNAVSWSGSIQPYYEITAEKLQAFIAPRGLFW